MSCAADDRDANRIGHNLDNIASALTGATGPPGGPCESWDAIEVFAGYLVFDAWIANTDRHAVNWGVLTRDRDGGRALASTFDHGSALASGTQDERLAHITPESFAVRGYASRFEDGQKQPLTDLALDGVRQVGGRASTWLDRLKFVDPAACQEILEAISGMSELRRRFLSAVLETNRRRLSR